MLRWVSFSFKWIEMGSFTRVGLTLFLCYGLYCLVLFFLQRHLVFPRYAIEVPPWTQRDKDNSLERWWIQTESGKTEAWYLSAGRSAPGPAVIFAHGNGEVIDFWPNELDGFLAMGIGVLLVEYPGYGRSEGAPSQRGITEVFLAAYDRLASRAEVDRQRILLFGRSLGGGVACAVARFRPAAALILMSTFTSVRAMSWRFLAPPILVRDPFDNLPVLRKYHGPVLVIHGRHDDIIPYRHGLAIAGAAEKSEMVTYACRHNDCPPNWTVFWKDVADFLKRSAVLNEPKGRSVREEK